MNNDHILPTTDPASGATDHSDGPKTFCLKLLVQHGMPEAGESRWAPWAALFATRLLTGLTSITLFVLLVLIFPWLSSLAAYAGFGFSGLTFLGLAICTFLQGKGARASRSSRFSTAVVFLHSVTGALSVFLITRFVGVVLIDHHQRGGFHPSSLILLTPLIAYLLDVLVMQARIRLHYRYSLFFLILLALYTIIEIVVLRVTCPSCMHFAVIGSFAGINLGIGLVASLFAVLLTRIPWQCFKN